MRSELVAYATAQGGLFTRAQALAAGYTPREVAALTRRGGQWAPVLRGVYAIHSELMAGDQRDRWLMRDRAALLTARTPSTLSHDSAARVLAIDTLSVDEPLSHITTLGIHRSRRNGSVVRHHDQLPLCHEWNDGLLSTSHARTAVDIGRLHGYRHGLVAVDSVRRQGVPLPDLHAELNRMRNHPYIARAAAAVADSDPGSESVLETLGRELVHELGLGPIETQFAVRLANGRTAWCDLRVGCHIIECHGFMKLLSPGEGGVATEPAATVLWKQKARETAICELGLGLSTITWADCFGARREETKIRIKREYEVTLRRFGAELPKHLQEFAHRHPRERRTRLWTPDLKSAG